MSKQTLTYWDSNPNSGRTEAFTLAGQAFCEQEGLEFIYEPKRIDTYLTDVMTAWSRGTGPDIVDIWPIWLPQLIERDLLQPLDSWVNSWQRASDYESNHRRLSSSVGGHFWFLACDLFIQGTHYRKDLIKRAGLRDPAELDARGLWTIERFVEYAVALHTPENDVVGVSLRGGQGGELTAFNIAVNTGPGSLFDSSGKCLLDAPEACKGLEQYTSLAATHRVTQTTAAQDGYQQCAWRFYEGHAAMMIHNDDAAKAVQNRYLGPEAYGNCRIPSVNGNPRLGLAGFGVGVYSGSPVIDAASRYACHFVENYGRNLRRGTETVGVTGPLGVSCGPLKPWPKERNPIQEPFRRAMESSDGFYALPFGLRGYKELIESKVSLDLQRLLKGECDAQAVSTGWASALTSLTLPD